MRLEAGWPPDVLRHNEASAKAEALLKTRLGAEWDLFQKTGTIVRSSTRWPDIDYYVRRGEKVQVVRRGRVTAVLCVTPTQGEPEADRLMTILDLLETDERRLWQMANATAGGFPIRALGRGSTGWRVLFGSAVAIFIWLGMLAAMAFLR